eukprot:NODE_489_length_6860_cov_1.209289.p6 type:complete len:142 gc:universal NODE_489_length_6860_cov_1.209289:5882-5457(-)
MSFASRLFPYWYIVFPTATGTLYFSTLYFRNQQRAESSLTNSVMLAIKNDEELKNVLGKNIRIGGWLFPWVDGVVNSVKGIYDVDFKVKGDDDELSMKVVMTRVPNSSLWRLRYWTASNPDVRFKGELEDEETGRIKFHKY